MFRTLTKSWVRGAVSWVYEGVCEGRGRVGVWDDKGLRKLWSSTMTGHVSLSTEKQSESERKVKWQKASL
jgi:hypothetical protein